jgi:branched-chain amino acid transport system ATP-binding protein
MSVLTLSHLTKSFGGLKAVDDVSVDIEKGRLYGMIGPNGAGKTTVFNLITGIYVPTAGSITFNGREIGGAKPHEIAQLGCARTFQNLRLFNTQTVLDNVCIAMQLHMTPYTYWDAIMRSQKYRDCERETRETALNLLRLVGLGGREDERASSLPYGFQRRLEIARALAIKPSLLLLDEPAAGMNPDESLAIMEVIRKVRDEFDLTILLIEHHMEVVMGICDEITVLNFGKQIATGTPEQIQNDPVVVDAYLGQEVEEE